MEGLALEGIATGNVGEVDWVHTLEGESSPIASIVLYWGGAHEAYRIV
jgi:hypothetical protein